MSRRSEGIVAGALLTLFVALSGTAVLRQSPTVDEFAHLPAGYHYLVTGDLSRYAKNPPLAKVLAALPLLAFSPPPEDGRADEPAGWGPWLAGSDFMRRNADRYHRIYVAGRAVILLLGAILGACVWRAARSLYGPGGGLAALGLFCLSPDFLAHSALVTTDVAAALSVFVAVLAFLRFLERATLPRSLLAGLLLGLALLTKFTALLLVPAFLAAAAFAAWRTRARRDRRPAGTPRRLGLAAGCLVLFGTSWLVLLAGYRFDIDLAPLSARPALSEALAALRARFPALVLPLPSQFLAGLDAQWHEVTRYGFPNYLFGEWYEGGRWYYFPLAFLVKTPLPALAAIAAGILLRRSPAAGKGRFSGRELALLAAAAWLAIGIAANNTIQAGVRYLLPAYPFLYVIAGRIGSAELVQRGGRPHRIALALGALALAAGTLRVHPHYLSYFNALAGGAENGYHVLLDSNVDWGQDLPALAAYMREHGDARVNLAYFGPVDPEIYGIRHAPLTQEPRQGLTAISVATLMGFDFPMMYEDPWRHPPLEAAARYRGRAPAGRAGYSILLYRD